MNDHRIQRCIAPDIAIGGPFAGEKIVDFDARRNGFTREHNGRLHHYIVYTYPNGARYFVYESSRPLK